MTKSIKTHNLNLLSIITKGDSKPHYDLTVCKSIARHSQLQGIIQMNIDSRGLIINFANPNYC